ncbi:hypothetical protein Rsub_00163 [Raphidocelis subcapitata]|uniref:Uncharacterized protein n=1 Tax=Raphidocelis subcapitata TaxID=307507 RepID=A0A2V0NM45_9CHLO|nr:hypothetical protein Rsub_00163 [Raphidocelis subcapitata]|eukprot:GBF87452.1 hypothetical protein Rsub_00163 [Raphidocelis subcapitata]
MIELATGACGAAAAPAGGSAAAAAGDARCLAAPPSSCVLLVLSGSDVFAVYDCDAVLHGKTLRLDLPPCPEPCALQLMLVAAPQPCVGGTPPAATSVAHLASLPVLPSHAAAEARRLLLRQVAAAPHGARAALERLDGGGDDALPAPAAWAALPDAARAAIGWAWREHFAPFAADLAFVLAGPGPASARAALLESLLRFAAACAMADTVLHMLHTCTAAGVVELVGDGAAPAASALVRPAPLVPHLGFVAASDVISARAARCKEDDEGSDEGGDAKGEGCEAALPQPSALLAPPPQSALPLPAALLPLAWAALALIFPMLLFWRL